MPQAGLAREPLPSASARPAAPTLKTPPWNLMPKCLTLFNLHLLPAPTKTASSAFVRAGAGRAVQVARAAPALKIRGSKEGRAEGQGAGRGHGECHRECHRERPQHLGELRGQEGKWKVSELEPYPDVVLPVVGFLELLRGVGQPLKSKRERKSERGERDTSRAVPVSSWGTPVAAGDVAGAGGDGVGSSAWGRAAWHKRLCCSPLRSNPASPAGPLPPELSQGCTTSARLISMALISHEANEAVVSSQEGSQECSRIVGTRSQPRCALPPALLQR